MGLFRRSEVLRPEEWDEARDHEERLVWEAQRRERQHALALNEKLPPTSAGSFDVDTPESIHMPPTALFVDLSSKEQKLLLQTAVEGANNAELAERHSELARELGDKAWEAAKNEMSGARRKR
jgi:hypothetical protein